MAESVASSVANVCRNGAALSCARLESAVVLGVLGASAARLVEPAGAARGLRLDAAPPMVHVATQGKSARAVLRSSEEAIVAEGLWFRPSNGSDWIVRGADLRVRAGELRELTGPSGSGKTTLLRLTSGLLTPTRGSVRIFGVAPRAVRGEVLYLPQSPALFGGTIIDVLTTYSRGAPRRRILEIAERIGLLPIVERMPLGFKTVLAEGANNLSGGERQLLLLCAAVASSCPILLLDEGLASLDPASRQRVRSSGVFEGRTVVLATHVAVAREASPIMRCAG
jgi:ABC-type bacteriocin/lantibiotic exporter with double-glycine peptidase domain